MAIPGLGSVGVQARIVTTEITRVLDELAAPAKSYHQFGTGNRVAADLPPIIPEPELPKLAVRVKPGGSMGDALASYNAHGMGKGSESAAQALRGTSAPESVFTRPPGAHNAPGNDHGIPGKGILEPLLDFPYASTYGG